MQRFYFSTAAFPAKQRVSAWREIFGRTVVNLDIQPNDPASFSSEAVVCQVPGLGVLHAKSGGMHLVHSRDLIKDDDLSFMAAPTCDWTASQLGRSPVLGPGAGVLMNNAEMGSMTLASESRFITFRVRSAAMKPLIADLNAVVAQRIPADNPALGLLVGYLNHACNSDILADPALQQLAVDHVHDLLAVALGATRDAAEMARGRGLRAARLVAAREFVRKNLRRQDLRVGVLATQLGVTPRYLQMLFEAEGTTFSKYVLEQRLLAARRELVNPRLFDRPINLIAYDCGFGDLSYFNRAFRRRFGCTPTDARQE